MPSLCAIQSSSTSSDIPPEYASLILSRSPSISSSSSSESRLEYTPRDSALPDYISTWPEQTPDQPKERRRDEFSYVLPGGSTVFFDFKHYKNVFVRKFLEASEETAQHEREWEESTLPCTPLIDATPYSLHESSRN